MNEEVGPARPGAGSETAALIVVWLLVGIFWVGLLAVLGSLLHQAVASLWVLSAVTLAAVVGRRMVRVRREPRAVATLACWWFVASLAGPAALVISLPWLGGLRRTSLAWIERLFTSPAATRRWTTATAALLVHVLAAFSWLFFCGGFLAALALPNEGVSMSDLGFVLFGVVPAALWVVAAGAIAWRLRVPGRSVTDAALPVEGTWWVVSAIAAYAIGFSV